MKKKFLFLALLASATFVKAQTNFSGSWAEPNLEMVEGKQYSNAMPVKIVVSQTKDSIKMERTEAGEETTTSSQTFALNGKTAIRLGKTSKRTISNTATWSADKKTLTIVTTYSYAEKPTEIEYKNTEIWQINNEGSLFISKTSDATVIDDWIIKAVFKKI